MNIEEAKLLLVGSHKRHLETGKRAYGYMLEGMSGVGKSQGAFQYGETLCRMIDEPIGIQVSMLANMTSPDVRGFMIPLRGEGITPRSIFSEPPWYPVKTNIHVVTPPKKEGGPCEWFKPGQWKDAVPEVGYLFLDEWGQAEEDLRKAAAPLLLDGEVGEHRLPEMWRVVAAQNRVSDRAGVMRELMHLVSRRCLLEIESDPLAWHRWADDQLPEDAPHPLTRAFASKQPDIVFPNVMPDKPDPYCTPRTLCMMDRDIRMLQSQEDIDHDRLPMTKLALELCSGYIGKPAAAQFMTHLRFAEELPDIEDIFKHPREAKLPPGKDAQMICTFMLSPLIDEDNARSILRYVGRFNREMQQFAMSVFIGDGKDEAPQQSKPSANSAAQVRRIKAMSPVPEYQQWLVENMDVLVAARGVRH